MMCSDKITNWIPAKGLPAVIRFIKLVEGKDAKLYIIQDARLRD